MVCMFTFIEQCNEVKDLLPVPLKESPGGGKCGLQVCDRIESDRGDGFECLVRENSNGSECGMGKVSKAGLNAPYVQCMTHFLKVLLGLPGMF